MGLEREFAGDKRARELDKEELARMEITVHLRKLVILAAKVSIDEIMEELRQEKLNLERLPFDSKSALLDAQLLTAEKKLEVIPYIEEVLGKQESVIAEEGNNVTLKDVLISAKDLVLDEKANVISSTESLNGKIAELVAAKDALVTVKGQIITAKELLNSQKAISIGYLNDQLGAIDELVTSKLGVVAEKKLNIGYMDRYLIELEILLLGGRLWQKKQDLIPEMEEYIVAIQDLNTAKEGLIQRKGELIVPMQNYMTALEEEADARVALVEKKALNTSKMDAYIGEYEALNDEKRVLADKKNDNISLLEKLYGPAG